MPAVVTSRMIEAGTKAIEQWKTAPAYVMAAAVYRAMADAAPSTAPAPAATDLADLPPTMLEALRLLGYPAGHGKKDRQGK